MKTIVRIEHKNGYGIWRALNENEDCIINFCSFYSAICDKHDAFPTPYEEGLNIDTTVDFCAFKSIPQLELWIEHKWLKELFENDFSVLLLEVSNWKEGEYQILFKKEDIISSKDVTSLFC